jgi:hypothetical protein
LTIDIETLQAEYDAQVITIADLDAQIEVLSASDNTLV